MADVLRYENGKFGMDYVRFGGGKKPFVIIPGLGIKSIVLSAPVIEKAYSVFCEDYTVYVLDRRDFIPEGFTVFDMADDIAEVMKALGLGGACVFGTSQGGMIAQIIAAQHPDLADTLVLGSTAARIFPQAEKVVENWVDLAEKGRAVELCRDFVDRLYSKEFAEKFGDMIVKFNADASDAELERFARLARACTGFDLRDEIRSISCPVLVLGAENDRVLTGEASAEIASILGCGIYMYPKEYGHAVYDEANDYKQRILDFDKGRGRND